MRMIVAFEKTERVRHIGHLDIQRAMQRALRRSGLPVRYSQGFNPHAVLSFASPLPVGVGGAEELMDVALESDVGEAAFAEALTAALPPSLPLRAVRAVDDRFPALMAQLRTAEYEAVFLPCEEARAMARAVPALLGRQSIPAVRRTKSGEKPCDIRPMLHALAAGETPSEIRFTLRVSLTERETLKPDLLLSTLATQAGVALPAYRLRRLRLYGETDHGPKGLLEMCGP